LKYYTGIGSRSTPHEILELMIKIAKYFRKKNYILRSGGADGADLAFELGAKNKKEIFLPWKGFNNSKDDFIKIPDKAFEIAERYHPNWGKLTDHIKKLHARNSLQVLGDDLNTPSCLIICWTKNGKMVGGTAQALRIAKDCNIRIYNMGRKDELSEIINICELGE
jgi:hypothetical protein